jgi:hypothetical protein
LNGGSAILLGDKIPYLEHRARVSYTPKAVVGRFPGFDGIGYLPSLSALLSDEEAIPCPSRNYCSPL